MNLRMDQDDSIMLLLKIEEKRISDIMDFTDEQRYYYMEQEEGL